MCSGHHVSIIKIRGHMKKSYNILMVLHVCISLQIANKVCKELHLDESNTYLAQGKFWTFIIAS